jgi:hypothetical protein
VQGILKNYERIFLDTKKGQRMKGENSNSAEKEKRSMVSTANLPDLDNTEDRAKNDEHEQGTPQRENPDLVGETRIHGEMPDKETIAGGSDKSIGTEEVKAQKEKKILSEIAEVPNNKDEGAKAEDQEETAELEEERTDKKSKPEGHDLNRKTSVEEKELDDESKEEEKPYNATHVEENSDGDQDEKTPRRIGSFVTGIILAVLLVSALFALIIYIKKPEPEINKSPKLSSPAHAFKSEAKHKETIHKSDHFSLVHEKLTKVSDMIQGMQNKQKAITDLKQEYQQGITEAEELILKEIQSNQATDFKGAIKNKRVELCLLTIQRRQVYINELDRLLDQMVMDLEEMIYLKRGVEIDMLMVNVLNGTDMGTLLERIDTVIQQHIQDNEKLTISTKFAKPQSLNTIWKKIYGSRLENAFLSSEEMKNREIWKEICSGNYSRKHQLTALSLESAEALSEWEGQDLFLVKLAELSPEEAKYLSRWKGSWLALNGLTTLSPDAAKNLSQWQGKRLSLNGLKEVSPEVVEYLSQWQGEELELASLENITQWEESGKIVRLPDKHRKAIMK